MTFGPMLLIVRGHSQRLQGPFFAWGEFKDAVMRKVKWQLWFRTSVGRQQVAALTGVLWLLFLAVHLAGNLLLLGGPRGYNAWAEVLAGPLGRGLGGLLLVLLAVHLVLASSLWWQNRPARPVPYALAARPSFVARLARSMPWTGAAVLGFVVLHLYTVTAGPAPLEIGAGGVRRDVYALVVGRLGQPAIAGLYLAGLAALALHLVPPCRSLLLVGGVTGREARRRGRRVLAAGAGVLLAGFALVPLYCLTRSGPEPAPESPATVAK